MTEREKMIDAIRGNIEYELRSYPDDNYVEVVFDYGAIADALIGAGIGEVRDAEYRAEVAERQAIFLSKMLADKTRKDYLWQAWYDYGQQQAEKEITEEKKEE